MNRHTGAAFGIDSNGNPTETVTIDGQTIVYHYEDIPESDITTVNGLRCTTVVRTIIDLAVDLTRDELAVMMRDGLDRGLFTVEEMTERLAKADMRDRRGAELLRAFLRASGE